MRWIILSYLIFNPLFFWVNYNSRDVQQIFFQISSIVVFSLGMFFAQREIKFSKLNAAIGCLLIAFLFAWLRTLGGLSTDIPRYYIALNFICGFLVYLTVIKTFKIDDIKFIFKGLGYFTAFCIIILALQFFNYDFRDAVIWRGITVIRARESIFFQSSAMGMYFAHNLSLLLTLSPIHLLLFIPMLVSQSSAAIFGSIGAIGFFLWFRCRILFWIFMGICSFGMIVVFSIPQIRQETLTGFKIRLPLWGAVIQDITRYPLGHGLDSFANPVRETEFRYFNYNEGDSKYDVVRMVKENNKARGSSDNDNMLLKKIIDNPSSCSLTFSDHPHNEYLWLAYEIGVQALVILGFIFYFIWDRFKRSKREIFACASMGVLICLAIECLTQFPFHLARIGHILPIVLGIFYLTTED